MITPEEREEIINTAVEKALLLIPDTVGHLMVEHATLSKLNRKLYEEHSEFKGKEDVVASVVEMVEGENPLMKYEDILKKAVPKIKERIKTVKSLDMATVSPSPNRDFKNIEVPQMDKVSPHGEV